MDRTLILYPLAAQVLLTALVWCWMYITRLREMKLRGVAPQQLATSRQLTRQLKTSVVVAENFSNLFEIPVLFYAAAILLYAGNTLNSVLLGLAWMFVLLRCGHSLIHISYNRVMHRFLVYLASTLSLWLLWLLLIIELLKGRAL